jgi:hypothetical protein
MVKERVQRRAGKAGERGERGRTYEAGLSLEVTLGVAGLLPNSLELIVFNRKKFPPDLAEALRSLFTMRASSAESPCPPTGLSSELENLLTVSASRTC